jgi:hypothetical protein
MTRIEDPRLHPSACTGHAEYLLAGESSGVEEASLAIAELVLALRELRCASSRRELVAAGSLLRARFSSIADGGPETLSVVETLARRRGAPIVLGAIAVSAARRAQIPLGLLAGPGGRFAIAHATLARPLVLALEEEFALRDIAGEEPSYRWLCAHGVRECVEALGVAMAGAPDRVALAAAV